MGINKFSENLHCKNFHWTTDETINRSKIQLYLQPTDEMDKSDQQRYLFLSLSLCNNGFSYA